MNRLFGNIIVIGIVLLAVIGTAVAVLVDYNSDKNDAALLAQLSEQSIKLDTKIEGLKTDIAQQVELRAAETNAGGYIVLFFEDVSENLYDVYEFLEGYEYKGNKYDYKGTVIMSEGKVPGEAGNISKENFDYILSNGWAAAIGGTEEIDMTAEDAPKLLDEYLTAYAEKLTEAGIAIPTTYCFDNGEYNKKFDEVLSKHGFNIVRHFGETGDLYGSSFEEDGIYYLGTATYKENSSGVQAKVDVANDEMLAFSVTVGRVMESVEDSEADCSYGTYKKMLNYLSDSNECPNLKIVNVDELYDEKLAQYSENYEKINEYDVKISKLKAELASAEKEMKNILEQLK